MDELRKQFGENLRALRDATDISQERLAELAGLDRTEISLLERGLRMPRLDTIVCLAKGLQLGSPAELLDDML